MKIVIIGGGPIGVEAALYGASAGLDVQLFERGRLCENVRTWGYIGLFTEWKRNRSPLAARLLREMGANLPPEDTTSSGDELANYVETLSRLEALQGRIFPHTEVVALTRERVLKSDFADDARRAQSQFRLIVRDANGERVVLADVVIDATGVYATPNPLGNGGAICPGETGVQSRIDYALPDVAGRDLGRFANCHTLVVGSGHSAASTLRSIGDLFETFPQTRVTWVVRRDVPPHGAPYTLDPNESSPHRGALHQRANALADDARVDFRPRTVVEAVENVNIEYSNDIGNGQFRVVLNTLENGQAQYSEIRCDNIACHTGFRPDASLWRELQIVEHPATGGPFGLGEVLLNANKRAGVGLSTGYAEKQTKENADAEPPIENLGDERNDSSLLPQNEPNFYVLGIKSYGRDAGFLMQNGFRQIRDAYKIITENSTFDLYGGALD